jgi:hypothetical protein
MEEAFAVPFVEWMEDTNILSFMKYKNATDEGTLPTPCNVLMDTHIHEACTQLTQHGNIAYQ